MNPWFFDNDLDEGKSKWETCCWFDLKSHWTHHQCIVHRWYSCVCWMALVHVISLLIKLSCQQVEAQIIKSQETFYDLFDSDDELKITSTLSINCSLFHFYLNYLTLTKALTKWERARCWNVSYLSITNMQFLNPFLPMSVISSTSLLRLLTK